MRAWRIGSIKITKHNSSIGMPNSNDQGLIIAVMMTVTIATTLPVTRESPSKNMAKTVANWISIAKMNRPINMIASLELGYKK